MKLLTKAIEAKLAKNPIYSQEKNDIAPILVKFFTPSSNWTWYVLEASKDVVDGDWLFFGLVEGHEKELGYFRLSELQSIKGPFGLGIERDMYFAGMQVNKTTNEVLKITVDSQSNS